MPKLSIPSFKNRRVLVTGASGFVGSHLTDRLLEQQAEVGVLGRQFGPLAARVSNLDFFQADLTDAARVQSALAAFQPEIVFHLAARPDGAESFEHAQAMIADNLLGTLNLLEAHRQAGQGLFIDGNSTKSYGNVAMPYREQAREQPNSSYAISKSAVWHFCQLYSRLYDFPVVCLRPTIIYGPGQTFNLFSYIVQCLDRGQQEIRLSGGKQTRDALYIEDAVNAYLACARADLNGRIINIGGGEEHTIQALAEQVVIAAGENIPVVCDPSDTRPTEIWRSYCDNSEVTALTGWQPTTSLAVGLKKTIAWLRQHADQATPPATKLHRSTAAADG